MIIDLRKFIARERSYWTRLEKILDRMENNPDRKMDMGEVKEFHYHYQRASADLAKITTFSSERNVRRYLESLVARAYGEIHETRTRSRRPAFLRWFFQTFPMVFRRHVLAFYLSAGVMLAGFLFGGLAITYDTNAKAVLMPFSHLQMDPSERVAKEEGAKRDRLENAKTTFSSILMTHNTRVSVSTMALGMTWGIGTLVMLFYNGVLLGAVAFDYILAGQMKFLLGWLLPHGAVEIPAILLAGQAGLVLGGALIGWGRSVSLRNRLRKVSGDLVTLIFGVSVMLVWAGIVEAFLSQYHEPVIPYEVKIAFGIVELAALVLFFAKSGRNTEAEQVNPPGKIVEDPGPSQPHGQPS